MMTSTNIETRIYAPAENPVRESEGFPQLTTADTGWTEEERKSMIQHGYDGMDMLRAWLD